VPFIDVQIIRFTIGYNLLWNTIVVRGVGARR
jgi:hypothetical protein